VDVKEPLIKSDNSFNRHSGACQNPLKTDSYWMLVFTSMTAKGLNQRFLNSDRRPAFAGMTVIFEPGSI